MNDIIDATVEEDSDIVFVGMNSVNGWILSSRKIKSEGSEHIIPALEDTKNRYGEPLAIKRDMGKGMELAVSEVFPNTPDTICHYHFLRDIGTDILSEQYDSIRKTLIDSKIRTRLNRLSEELTVEINDAGYDMNVKFESIVDCDFEDLERCDKARIMVEKLVLLIAELKRVYKPFIELKKILIDVDDQNLKNDHAKMEYGRNLFARLREILRFDHETVPLSSVLDNLEMQSNGLLILQGYCCPYLFNIFLHHLK